MPGFRRPNWDDRGTRPGNEYGGRCNMRITRTWFPMAVVGIALAALSGCAEMSQSANNAAAADAAAHGSAPPARARSAVFVQVSPTTAQPGSTVQIRASCVDNSASATVTSRAFGSTTVLPSNSVLFAEVTIPANAGAGRFDVTVTCRNGSTATTSLTIMVTSATATQAPATRGPNTGGGYLARQGGVDTSTDWATRLQGPAGWFGIGVVALLAAAAIGLRSHRMSRAAARARPRQPVPVEREQRETTR